MFFILSKIFWMLFRPLNLLFALAVVAGVCGWLGYRRLAVGGLVVLAIAFATIAFTQLPDWLILQLEKRSRPVRSVAAPHGIIVLGGGLIADTALNAGGYNLGEAGDRIIKGIELKRRYPSARLIYSGGRGNIGQSGPPETTAAEALISALAGNELRIEREPRSRNTWQNAAYTAAMIGDARKRDWLLVTSAFHMPRAIGCFREAGFNIEPAPTDFRADPIRLPFLTDKSAQQFLKFNLFVKEVLGLIAYRATGRI
jgi:uncharacterized SAM-binding protein YcdF (DUF218 family)